MRLRLAHEHHGKGKRPKDRLPILLPQAAAFNGGSNAEPGSRVAAGHD